MECITVTLGWGTDVWSLHKSPTTVMSLGSCFHYTSPAAWPLPATAKFISEPHHTVSLHSFPPAKNMIISSRGLQPAYFTPTPPQQLFVGVGQYRDACFVQETGTEQELDSWSRFSSKFISRPFISSHHTMSNPLEITFSRKPCYWNKEMP